MAAVKIYLDEDVHPFIADALRLRGWEALTTLEARQGGAADPEQLRFAADGGYSILSYNVKHFAALHYQLIADGGSHGGIILARQREAERNVRPLLNLLNQVSAAEMLDQLVYLTNWL